MGATEDALPAPGAGSFHGVDLAIVLPTLNERDGLREIYPELPLAALRAQGWNARVLLVDGGSTDGTLDVARELGLTVLPQRGRGKGRAIQQALDWLHHEAVAYAIVLDADWTYPGSAIAPMAALLEVGCDVVVGVRYPGRVQAGAAEEFVHRWGNAGLNFSASVLSGRPILDLCSGLWGVRVAAAVDLRLESPRFQVEAELFIKAYRQGLVYAQIPIVYRRRVGQAKLRAVRDGLEIFRTLVRWSAAAGHGPLPEPFAARRSIRLLLTVVFVHEVRELVLRAAPERQAEAAELARELARIGVQPQLLPAPAQGDPFGISGLADAPGPGVTIVLPGRNLGGEAGPYALVSIPYRHRVVLLGGSERARAAGVQAFAALGYHHESRRRALGLLASLQAAHASVTSRRPRQESALLRANAYRTEIQIFQGTGPRLGTGRAAATRAPDGREAPR